ncbi:ABC transporter permease [Calidifontibacter terrae]
MTVAEMTPTQAPARAARGLPTYRFEMDKQLSQWRVRMLLGACLLGPALFVAVVSNQSALPTDTVFGRWMHATGWAGSLMLLTFCCNWVLPLLMSVVAGDVFAAEDRLGTWRHLVTAVRSPRRIFVGKAAATVTVLAAMTVALCVSSVVGGLLAVGNHPLVGLDGATIDSGHAARLVLLAWSYVGFAALAFAAVGLLGSVLFGRSPMGLLLPAVFVFVLQLVQMLPLPVAVRMALPSQSFVAWRGLFTDPTQTRPLLLGFLVSAAWIVVPTLLAYAAFRRRDFTDLHYDGSVVRTLRFAALPLAGLLVAGAVLATPSVADASGSGISKVALERSMATSFAHLYRMQSRQLGHPAVTEQQLRSGATCDKAGSSDNQGPGNDWRCVVTWHIPGATVVGSAIYQLDVAAEGRYIADGDGPKEVNGYFPVPTSTGEAPNPLWQIDGLADVTAPSPKG